MYNVSYYCGEAVQKLLLICGEVKSLSPSLFLEIFLWVKAPTYTTFCPNFVLNFYTAKLYFLPLLIWTYPHCAQTL